MTDDALSLCDEIINRRYDRYARDKGRAPIRQYHPRASSIGECAREIYYQITEWELRPPPEPELMQRFRRGSDVERIVLRELLEDGWDIVEQQLPFEIREGDLIICTGHADMRIEYNGSKPVAEIKSLNPNVWGQIESARDFRRMGSFWTKYPRQLLLYMYHFAEPFGLYILDDCCGHIKVIPMVLDDWLDECEDALRTARTAAEHVVLGEPPPFCQRRDVCAECWCRKAAICFPPIPATDAPTILDQDASLIADVAMAVEGAKEFDEAKKVETRLKKIFKAMGVGTYILGENKVEVRVKGKDEKTFVTWGPLPGAPQKIAHAASQPDVYTLAVQPTTARSGAEAASTPGGAETTDTVQAETTPADAAEPTAPPTPH